MHGCAAPGDESFLRGLGEVAGSDVALAAFTRFFWWYEWTDGCVCMYVCMYVRIEACMHILHSPFTLFTLICFVVLDTSFRRARVDHKHYFPSTLYPSMAFCVILGGSLRV